MRLKLGAYTFNYGNQRSSLLSGATWDCQLSRLYPQGEMLLQYYFRCMAPDGYRVAGWFVNYLGNTLWV